MNTPVIECVAVVAAGVIGKLGDRRQLTVGMKERGIELLGLTGKAQGRNPSSRSTST